MDSDENLTSSKLFVDNPIEDGSDDRLDRLDSARSFARDVLSLDATKGAVVGVFGPWGSGKTSFINLAREEFIENGASIVDFNPWMFSSSGQLVERFFKEIASQVDLPEHNKIVKELGLLGVDLAIGSAVFLSGGFFVVIQGLWNKIRQSINAHKHNKGRSVANRRDKIKEALAALDKEHDKIPIIVIIDDVDRLSDNEIGEIFKLIRLTANFPNIVYIVPCDRERIEDALDKDYGIGKNFLDKVVQLPFNLPEVPRDIVEEILHLSIQDAIQDAECDDPTEHERWSDVYVNIILPVIKNMRDVNRYMIGVRVSLPSLKGRISLVDLLALEAVRIFIPGAFNLLPNMIDILTVAPNPIAIKPRLDSFHKGFYNPESSDQALEIFRKRISKLTDADEKYIYEIEALLSLLFPAAKEYYVTGGSYSLSDDELLENRVVDQCTFSLYLERSLSSDALDSKHAETAIEQMISGGRFHRYMYNIDSSRWLSIFRHMHNPGRRFPFNSAPNGIVELLNFMGEIPNLSMNPAAQALLRQILRDMMAAIPGMDQLKIIIRNVSSSVGSISSRWQLFLVIKDHYLASFHDSDTSVILSFSEQLITDVQMADSEALGSEWNLAETLKYLRGLSQGRPDVEFRVDESPFVTMGILWSARKIDKSIDWGLVNDALGGDENAQPTRLKERLEDLKNAQSSLQTWMEQTLKIPYSDAEYFIEKARMDIYDQ